MDNVSGISTNSKKRPAKKEMIKVICRVKPVLQDDSKGKNKGDINCLTLKGSEITVATTDKNKKFSFTFDNVLDGSTEQEEVFNTVGRTIVNDIYKGYNGTIFAYGQTASGKTHTMEGDLDNPKNQGIIPRVVNSMYDEFLNKHEYTDEHDHCLLSFSYFEVYKEHIQDLLTDTDENLLIQERENGVQIAGLMKHECPKVEDVFELLKLGRKHRTIGETKMNDKSSRSHAICQISYSATVENKQLDAVLNLVDLAGSEKVDVESDTGNSGIAINKSLSHLCQVINELGKNNKHVSFRNSKLTRLLQNSLGGNAKTAIIICVSPLMKNSSETMSTCRFGQSAKKIKNVAVQNVELKPSQLKKALVEKEAEIATISSIALKYEEELKKWRKNIKVPEAEWTVMQVTRAGSPASPETSPAVFASNESVAALQEKIDQLTKQLEDEVDGAEQFQRQIREAAEHFRKMTLDLEDERSRRTQCEADSKGLYEALEESNVNVEQLNNDLTAKNEMIKDLEKVARQNEIQMKRYEDDIGKLTETVDICEKRYQEKRNAIFMDVQQLVMLTNPKNVRDDLDIDFAKIRIDLEKVKLSIATLTGQKVEDTAALKLQELKKQEKECVDKISNLASGVDAEGGSNEALNATKSKLESQLRAVRSNIDAAVAASGCTSTTTGADNETINVISQEVIRELAQLKDLREAFVEELGEKIKASAARIVAFNINLQTSEMSKFDYTGMGTKANDCRMQYLEQKIQELTETHREMISDRAKMQIEHERMRIRNQTHQERIKQLEDKLKEEKEGFNRQKKKYEGSVEELRGLLKKAVAGRRRGEIVRPDKKKRDEEPANEEET